MPGPDTFDSLFNCPQMKSFYPILLIAVVVGFISCQDETGIREIELSLETLPFDRIRLETSSDIRIIQSNEYKVVLKGRENDVDDVAVNVINDRLTIEEHHHQQEIEIKIYVPEISQLQSIGSSLVYGESYFSQDRNMDISLEGSGEIDFAIETDDVDVELIGSGYIYLEGYVQSMDADIEGSGWVRSFDLESDLCDVRIEGSGSAEVFANDDLDVFITGSGNVYFKGHPFVNAYITGSGSVIDAN